LHDLIELPLVGFAQATSGGTGLGGASTHFTQPFKNTFLTKISLKMRIFVKELKKSPQRRKIRHRTHVGLRRMGASRSPRCYSSFPLKICLVIFLR